MSKNDAGVRRQYFVARSRLQVVLDEFERLPGGEQRGRPAASGFFSQRLEPTVTALVECLRRLDIRVATELMDAPPTERPPACESFQTLRAIWERGIRPRPRRDSLPVTPDEWEHYRELEKDIKWRRDANERPDTHLFYEWQVKADTAQLCVIVADVRDAVAVLDVYFPFDRSSPEEQHRESVPGDKRGVAAFAGAATAMTSVDGATTETAHDAPPATVAGSVADRERDAFQRILRVYAGGIVDVRLSQVLEIISNDKLSVDKKLWEIDKLMPIPPTASGETIGKVLGVSKAAVQNTTWYKQNRKGRSQDDVGRRQEQYRRRAQQRESTQAKSSRD